MSWRALPLLAVAGLGAGMALVAAGVRAGALFLPGVFLIGAGLLLAAAAGILSVIREADDARA